MRAKTVMFFMIPEEALAVQHIKTHRLFEVLQIELDLPPHLV